MPEAHPLATDDTGFIPAADFLQGSERGVLVGRRTNWMNFQRKGSEAMYLPSPHAKTASEQQVEPLAVDTIEAARLLGVSERTVLKLAKAGKISCKKVGWRSLYSVASLKAFLEMPDDE